MSSYEWTYAALTDIENELNNLLNISTKSTTLLEAMRYSSLQGGKRIRPLFTLASGKISQANYNNLLTIGAAIELIHCFSLIHDDLPIMDNDDLRRGKLTNHKVYGDAIALLAGDALHSFAFEILSSNRVKLPDNNKIKIIYMLSESIGLMGMVGGQSIDWLSTGTKLKLSQLEDMHSLKTGALLKCSILCGYLAGNTYDEQRFQHLTLIAKQIGLLFQIVDDIIDFTEDTATLGKTANKDLLNHKATYVNILGLEATRQTATKIYNNINNELIQYPYSHELQHLTDLVYTRKN